MGFSLLDPVLILWKGEDNFLPKEDDSEPLCPN